MKELQQILTALGVECVPAYPLSKHSSFRIGGAAKLACLPKSREELLAALKTALRMGVRYAVVGNASNLVFDDLGFDGLVILTGGWKELSVRDTHLDVSAGTSLYRIATAARDASLTGAEFMYGIPGTLGGAIFMNAGAFGGSMADICLRSEYFDAQSGTTGWLEGEAQAFANRSSIYEKEPRYTVLRAELRLANGNREEIGATMEALMERRRTTQPLEFPSAGSVFKRPVGHFAGKLIEDCGLKGVRVGGAEVSQKHAGFIVNRGGATAKDVRELVELIRERVLREYGVCLECEIRFLT